MLDNLLTADAVRRVIRTFLIAFLGLAVPGFLGWLNDLTAWANSQGQSPFPDAHSLVYLAVAATGGAVIAVVNAIVVLVENATGKGFLRPVATPVVRRRRGARGAIALRPLHLVVVTFLIGIGMLILVT